MDTTSKLIEVERQGDTLVLTPRRDLRELEFEEIEAEWAEVLSRLEHEPHGWSAVVDFGHTDYFGSTALGMLTRLWQWLRARGGRMALCHLSAHEREILTITGLIGLWPIYNTRKEAVEAMGEEIAAA